VTSIRIALANLPFPSSAQEAVLAAKLAIAKAGEKQADVICFPECFLPGYRGLGRDVERVDAEFLEHAWKEISDSASQAKVTTVLGTERIVDGQLRISALVINADGTRAGFQDKVQLDPSEESTYVPGSERQVFQVGDVTFGIVICHEGWRYPETVRWAARRGAQLVFHPHLEESEGYEPTSFAHPSNTFHEKAMLCRAAENSCFFASVNYAKAGSATTSAVINPDGTLLCHQPYGEAGLLIADIDVSQATRLLAERWKPQP
jgi:predicted amidohydrolase